MPNEIQSEREHQAHGHAHHGSVVHEPSSDALVAYRLAYDAAQPDPGHRRFGSSRDEAVCDRGQNLVIDCDKLGSVLCRGQRVRDRGL